MPVPFPLSPGVEPWERGFFLGKPRGVGLALLENTPSCGNLYSEFLSNSLFFPWEEPVVRQTPTIPPAEITRQLALCDQIHALLDQTPGQKLAFVDTYGCQQNEADSERLRGYLARMAMPSPTPRRGPTWCW